MGEYKEKAKKYFLQRLIEIELHKKITALSLHWISYSISTNMEGNLSYS